MRKGILIEAPSNLGLIEPQPGIEAGVKYFPEAMLKANFAESAGIENTITVTPPVYSGEIDSESKVRNCDKIIDYSKQLANVIEENIQKKKFQIVIGGDCSILIGACLALKRKGNFGLFYLDGHTDYVLPHQSGSNGAAGMNLAIVTGNGHNKLTNIEHLKPYIMEENVFCCGNRDVAIDGYVNTITQSNIPYYDLYSLRKKGVDNVINEFLQMVASKNLAGFWIHFDVDALDDAIMPCVDSRQEGGMSYDELKQTLQPLISSPLCCGIEITIFDPTLDKGGEYGNQLAMQLADIFKQLPNQVRLF